VRCLAESNSFLPSVSPSPSSSPSLPTSPSPLKISNKVQFQTEAIYPYKVEKNPYQKAFTKKNRQTIQCRFFLGFVLSHFLAFLGKAELKKQHKQNIGEIYIFDPVPSFGLRPTYLPTGVPDCVFLPAPCGLQDMRRRAIRWPLPTSSPCASA
jgi:hypothetical protein